MEKGASEVYGIIAGYRDDTVIPAVDAADEVTTDGIFANGVFVAAGNGCDGVSVAACVGADGVSVTSSDATDAETQFALMGLSPQAKIDKMNNQVKLEESNARFDKWKESSKNLVKLINSSMSSRLKFGLGYGDWKRIFKKRNKKKAKTKHEMERTKSKNHLTQQAHLVFALSKEAQAASPREEDFGYK
ncbi:hypothetical protein Tco_1262362 [Tanacetum coccineum]